MTDLLAVRLDVTTAAHLVHAIDRWQAECRRDAVRVPPGLLQLRGLIQVTAGHNGSTSPPPGDLPHTSAVTPLLLSFDHAADVLEVSHSTVKRLVRTGQLPAVKVGGSPRIRKADLDAYVAGLTPVVASSSDEIGAMA